MATEESPKLPPYSELVLAAISSLDEAGGSSKAAISKHIEDAHSPLPDDHAALLTAELARMKEDGELTLNKNNYLIPASETPAKRGRGRPPKAKTPGGAPAAPASGDGSVKRGRGRPPKAGKEAGETPVKASSGKGRGRPPKVKDDDDAPAKAAKSDEVASPASGAKRGRGRPPKVKAAAADVAA